jgi:hypothetical protein
MNDLSMCGKINCTSSESYILSRWNEMKTTLNSIQIGDLSFKKSNRMALAIIFEKMSKILYSMDQCDVHPDTEEFKKKILISNYTKEIFIGAMISFVVFMCFMALMTFTCECHTNK